MTKSQLFADSVFGHVSTVTDGDCNLGKYKALCKRAGSVVRSSGLCATLAFFQARGTRDPERQYHVLLMHIQEELLALHLVPAGAEHGEHFWLPAHVRTAPLPRYMHLTREILRLLQWHKRLAETLIEVPEEEAGVEDQPEEEE